MEEKDAVTRAVPTTPKPCLAKVQVNGAVFTDRPAFPAGLRTWGHAPISWEASYSCGFPACQPVPAATPHAAFVPLYRCASVPDSHRVPFCRTSGVDTPCSTGKTQTLTAPETARQAKMEMMVCLASNFVGE